MKLTVINKTDNKMEEYYKNLSLDDIVYLDEDGADKIEVWKDIPDYEGYYQVSDLGRVKSLKRTIIRKNFKSIKNLKCTIIDRILRQTIGSKNYFKVNLNKDLKVKTFQIHVLVAMAFLNHKPDGTHKIVVDHKLNIRKNNKLSNLQLITQRKNCSKDKINCSSIYEGVYLTKKNNFISQLQVKGRSVFLGIFTNEKEAGEAYKKAVLTIENGEELILKRREISSKYKGVFFNKRANKWVSSYYFKGKIQFISYCKTEQEAYELRCKYLESLNLQA
jgi:hypothetical protein